MLQNLQRFLAGHLLISPPSREEEALWVEVTRIEDHRNAKWFLGVMILINTSWTLTDPLVYDQMPHAQSVFAQGRPWLTGALLGLYSLAWVPALARRHVLFYGILAPLPLAVVAFYFAQIGGPSSPWIHLLYFLQLPSLGLSCHAPARAWVVAWFSLAPMLVYFATKPEFIHDPATRLYLSYSFFVALSTWFLGIGIENYRRAGWFLRRTADAHAREIDAINQSLSERVQAQTAELRHLTEELRALIVHTESAREDERTLLSRELHDELGQELTALRFALGVTRQRFERDPRSISHNLEQLDELLDETIQVTRALVRDLRPRLLEDLPLPDAARWLLARSHDRTGLEYDLEIIGDHWALPEPVLIACFRILQEALTNVARHAQAQHVWVRLHLQANMLSLCVMDDGIGLPTPQATRSGFGLIGVRERVHALGGQISLGPRPSGTGTEICAHLPLQTDKGSV